MQPVNINLLFAAHALLLVCSARSIAAGCFDQPSLRLLASVVLIWLNLIHSAQLASLGGKLGSPFWYLLCSAIVALIHYAVLRFPLDPTPRKPAPRWRDTLHGLGGWWATPVLVASIVLLAAGALAIALSVYANNWDTLAYRFPRAHFYLTTGALLHPGAGLDPRLLYYPYNGSLLYLFLAQYQAGGLAWNLFGYAAWLFTGAGAFELTRQLGAGARAALLTATLVLSTPIVLCLANSGNDELIGGLPLLLCAVFLTAWVQTCSPAAAAFALLALAICLGVKFHIVFLSPIAAFVLAAAFIFRRPAFIELLRSLGRRHALRLVLAAALALPAAGGFLLTNYLSAGQLMDLNFSSEVTNIPPHPGAALQNIQVYGWQLLLAPLPDHLRFLDDEQFGAVYRRVNDFTGPLLFSHVRNGPPYSSPYYQFRGLTPPDAVIFYEQTLWLGLVPWALLAGWVWLAVHRRRAGFALWILAAMLPLWHAAFSTIARYMETVGTYYAFMAGLGIPCLGLLWHRAADTGGALSRLIRFCVVLALVSNLWIAGLALWKSPKRNVTFAWRNVSPETPVSQTSPSLRPLIEQARQVHINYTHWELLYWNLMRLNPAARYSTGNVPDSPPPDLFIHPVSIRSGWEVPTPVRAQRAGLLRLAGTMSSGEDQIFCHGTVCEQQCRNCGQYALLPLRAQSSPDGAQAEITAPPGVLSRPAAVRLSLLRSTDPALHPAEWADLSQPAGVRHQAAGPGFDHLLVEIASGCAISRTLLPLQRGNGLALDPLPAWAVQAGILPISPGELPPLPEPLSGAIQADCFVPPPAPR